MKRFAVVLLFLSGCVGPTPKPVEVKVPVMVRAPAPPELLACAATLPPLPRFEACAPKGYSCLNPAQEAALRAFLHHLAACNDGWRAWGTSE